MDQRRDQVQDATAQPHSPAIVPPLEPSDENSSFFSSPGMPTGSQAGHGLPVRVGNYLLTREIATGGMGTVYEAVQDQPRRVVALKLLRVGRRSAPQQRRFQFESELLARLRHPGIAQVFEAGTHGEGDSSVPFYAMEFIPGAMPITSYAQAKKLSITDRLSLFADVCDAVQHANAKGIIHRDLKPGNILIDVQGQPKVIDFGVARAADSDQFSPTMQTDANQLIGTLQYMSPEQCEIDPRELDGRSDVYALGVVLYEMLCGRLPYDLSKINVSDATRIIRESPPARPSSINPSLKGDLETVVLKALHKDRERRYQSVGQLAADVRHAMGNEAIEARRDSATYVLKTRFRRSARRHRILAMILAVAVGLFFTEAAGIFNNRWFSINRHFERIITTYVPMSADASPTGHGLQHVRIIALHDGTNVAELANRFGLSGVAAINRPSLRRLHGAFMKTLAEKGVTVPVLSWDIVFRGDTKFDQDFIDGANALEKTGTEIIVAEPSWSATPSHDTAVSAAIRDRFKSGSARAVCTTSGPWQIDLVAWRPESGLAPQLSFAFATAAAFAHPHAKTSLLIEGGYEFTDVFYTNPDGTTARRRVRFTSFGKLTSDRPLDDLYAGDYFGEYHLSIPANQILDAATIDYAEAVRMPPEELQRRLNGCAVFVADYRDKDAGPLPPDYSPHPDGRRLPRCVIHAVAVESVLQEKPIRWPQYISFLRFSLNGRYFLDFAGIAIGAAIGIFLALRTGRRALAQLAAVVSLALFSALLYRYGRTIYNPFVAIVGVVLTAELVALAERNRRRGAAAQLAT